MRTKAPTTANLTENMCGYNIYFLLGPKYYSHMNGNS